MALNKQKFTSRKTDKMMNDKEARNKFKELAETTKAKEMTKLKEGNMISKQLENLNALRKGEKKLK